MRRTWLIVAAGVVAASVAAVAGWLAVRPTEPVEPPQLYGRVTAVSADGRGFVIDPFEGRYPYSIRIRDGVLVRRRGGGPAVLAVGQTVSAWCSGPVAASYPPIWAADHVVIEPDGL